jgi:hypothetical protein
MAGLNIHVVPLVVTLEGTSYREGVDVQPGEFYRLLAATDPGILSIHISSDRAAARRNRSVHPPARAAWWASPAHPWRLLPTCHSRAYHRHQHTP